MANKPYHSTSNLRLQVQTPAVGLPNLFPDPDGVLGTYSLNRGNVYNVLTSDGTKFTIGSGTVTSGLFLSATPFPISNYVRVRYTVTSITAGHTLRTEYDFYDVNGSFISGTTFDAPTISSGVSYGTTVAAPVGAAMINQVFKLYKGASATVDVGATATVNQVMVTTAATSAALNAPFSFVAPITWSSSILGTTHSIEINREALDAGTLAATILDATLDPSTSGMLNKDDAVRLQASVGGVWEDVFVGTIDDSDVTYVRDTDTNTLRTRITLTAVDNAARLANSPTPYGFGDSLDGLTTAGLPGRNVPWNVNGSRNVSYLGYTGTTSDGATALDQIVMARDWSRGYAWIDRHNVFTGYDSLNLITNPSATVDVSNWASSGTLTRDGTYGVGPAGSFKMVSAGGSSAGTVYAYPNQGSGFVTADGGTYFLEFWVFGTGSCYVQLYSNPAGTQFAISSTVTLSGSWQKITLVGTAPVGTTSIYPVIRQASAGAQTLYFDEVNLTPFGCYFSDVASAAADHDSYSAIDVGWNRDIFNQVEVTWLHRPTGGGSAENVAYGPYRDAVSVSKNGPKKRSFTLQGSTEDATAIYNWAAALLAANSTPVRKARSLVMPVLNARSFAHAATIDLYDQATVDYGTVLDDAVHRITGIHHRIETDRWIVTYDLANEGAAAA